MATLLNEDNLKKYDLPKSNLEQIKKELDDAFSALHRASATLCGMQANNKLEGITHKEFNKLHKTIEQSKDRVDDVNSVVKDKIHIDEDRNAIAAEVDASSRATINREER